MPRGMRSNATQDANKMPHRGYVVHTCMPEGILGYSSPSAGVGEDTAILTMLCIRAIKAHHSFMLHHGPAWCKALLGNLYKLLNYIKGFFTKRDAIPNFFTKRDAIPIFFTKRDAKPGCSVG